MAQRSLRKNTYLDLDDDDVVPDGGVVRTPLHLMDSMQRAIAGVNLSDHQPGYRTTADAKVRDARREARDARQAWIKQLNDAWRTPGRDAGPEPDAAEALLRRHLRTEPDDDAQARRDGAYRDYVNQLGTAWQRGRTDPREADRIERQRRGWTAERRGPA